MKRTRNIFLIILSLAAAGVLLVAGTTQAAFSSVSVNLENTFRLGEFGGPSLQECLDRIMADISGKNVLAGAHQNYNHKDSWSLRIADFVSGGSDGSNIYDISNPVSGSQVVLRNDNMDVGEKEWNPMMFITGNGEYGYGSISNRSDFSKLFGTMVIVKENGAHNPISYFVVGEDGKLGALQTIELP
ncbi:hypothetical protein KQH56_00750 [bacterium]|nr:hypothetical protein [bacterium]